MALSAAVVPLVFGVHVAPPSADPTIVPAAPTARQAVAELHATPASAFAPVPVPPFPVEPSVVKRTAAAPVATAPTATHAVVEVQATAFRLAVVPLVAGDQVWPPFVVFRIVPALPAA